MCVCVHVVWVVGGGGWWVGGWVGAVLSVSSIPCGLHSIQSPCPIRGPPPYLRALPSGGPAAAVPAHHEPHDEAHEGQGQGHGPYDLCLLHARRCSVCCCRLSLWPLAVQNFYRCGRWRRGDKKTVWAVSLLLSPPHVLWVWVGCGGWVGWGGVGGWGGGGGKAIP